MFYGRNGTLGALVTMMNSSNSSYNLFSMEKKASRGMSHRSIWKIPCGTGEPMFVGVEDNLVMTVEQGGRGIGLWWRGKPLSDLLLHFQKMGLRGECLETKLGAY